MAGHRSNGQRRRSDLPLNADINVTSLVDVAFTLLVIFIITAPILQGGIEVAVPRADVRPLTAQERPFYISVTADGTVFMEDTPMTAAEFEGLFGQLAVGRGLDRVFIRADSLADWGPVLKVMAAVHASEVDWSVVGEPYGPGR